MVLGRCRKQSNDGLDRFYGMPQGIHHAGFCGAETNGGLSLGCRQPLEAILPFRNFLTSSQGVADPFLGGSA